MNTNSRQRMSQHHPDFIDDTRFTSLLSHPPASTNLEDILAKSLAKNPLSLEETAVLLTTTGTEERNRILAAAQQLKEAVYGNRIVLFAPLYIGNKCVNDCSYCGFRRSNLDAVRRTLTANEITEQVRRLEATGHKRLILVFGEHPAYSPQFIANTVSLVSNTRNGHDEIRRVNINAAPLDHEGFAIVQKSGIGTFQVFQETYHQPTYTEAHGSSSPKGDYLWRLDALSRAMEAGCDDVGIGALFGLYDWRYEVLGLVAHANFLMNKYNCGPHTISFPRIRPASGMTTNSRWHVSDDDFLLLIAILRLSVPYTGLILTAREPQTIRDRAIDLGVSQIDAGSRIEIGGYTEMGDAQQQEQTREQFELGDLRSLDEIIRSLIARKQIPSFCTACYRLGRTGEHFMEFAIPGFIKQLCTPNALTTLQEYLIDYASAETRRDGEALIDECLAQIGDDNRRLEVKERLQRIRTTADRDLYF